ncbi:hypothetical protein [Spiroplasma melliferum]|uniref:Uncharacterized protein n=2 Tax=Spiroplasma melliferum TaxID=2134 RepID=A0AAI9X1T6_SPIME|nr:hypothetical protein [Spiroplasma melliferum]KAI93175.1 hypothetical protein SPM_003590 [Spiroplasma melliferum KC3]QCO24028.1 hypothetical protein SRED_002508 [Spiroplasma melliferum]
MEWPWSNNDAEAKLKELEDKTDKKIKASEEKCINEINNQLNNFKNETDKKISAAVNESEIKVDEKIANAVKDSTANVDEKISAAVNESEIKVDQKIIALGEKEREENSKNLIEITNIIDEKIKSLEEKQNQIINNLEDKLNKEKWIIGEYKWMPVGSKMPSGWVKVNMTEGHTLIAGRTAGVTSGSVGKHAHDSANNNSVWALRNPNRGFSFINDRDGGRIGQKYMPFLHDYNDLILIKPNASDTGKGISKTNDNMAAGLIAELWQYKG